MSWRFQATLNNIFSVTHYSDLHISIYFKCWWSVLTSRVVNVLQCSNNRFNSCWWNTRLTINRYNIAEFQLVSDTTYHIQLSSWTFQPMLLEYSTNFMNLLNKFVILLSWIDIWHNSISWKWTFSILATS